MEFNNRSKARKFLPINSHKQKQRSSNHNPHAKIKYVILGKHYYTLLHSPQIRNTYEDPALNGFGED